MANTVAGVTIVVMPYVGLTMGYLYFDARVRSELAHDDVAFGGPACGRSRQQADGRRVLVVPNARHTAPQHHLER